MELTPRQKLDFYEQGYLKLPGVVPQVMVEAARHAINHSIGEEGMGKDDLVAMRSRSYCQELQNASVITDLFNKSPIPSIAESLIGKGNVIPPTSAQIALRFPGPLFTDPNPPRGHLDGLGTGTNGIPKGEYRRGFTGLVVILLADVPEPYSGNFTVWPRSQQFFERFFKENGDQVLAEGMPRVDLPEGPIQMTGKAGDIILTHHQIVHCAAPNASANIRYAAIFRLRHIETEQIGRAAFTDIWREWPGVRAALQEAQAS
jgi:hypothetical protein